MLGVNGDMTMKGFATSISIWALLLAVPMAWAQSECPPHANIIDSLHIRPFGSPFTRPLGVQCVREVIGQDRTKLEGFELQVEAAYLGPDKISLAEAKSQKSTGLYSDETWFRWHTKNQIKYLKYDEKQTKHDTLKDDAWQKERERIQIVGRPLEKFGPKERLGSFRIQSKVEMGICDIVRLGKIDFQPENPGLYRLDLWLYPGHEQKSIEHKPLFVYFECPDYQPIASLMGSDTLQLHDIAYQFIRTPIVNGIFFEAGSTPQPMQNPTDRIFRALLFGRAIIGLPCRQKNDLQLLVLPDKLYAMDHRLGENLAPTYVLSENRAKHVMEEIEGLAADYMAGLRCGLRSAGNGFGKTSGDMQSRCQLKLELNEINRDTPQALELIKWKDSIDEPEKYRQENRVVALYAPDADDEKRLFEPLLIKHQEEPDYVRLRLKVEKTDGRMDRCLDAGWVVLRRLATGDSAIQSLSDADLVALRSAEIELALDKLKSFTSMPGDYEARVALRSVCDATVRYAGQRLRFHVKPKAVLLDEIFALSHFDQANFRYRYDDQRIPYIVDSLFQQIESAAGKTTADKDPIEALLLISGHTDVLSEHRGAFYNLGLSFMRAELAKQRFLAQIFDTAKQKKYTPANENAAAFDATSVCYISKSMRLKMASQLYANTATQEFFKSLLPAAISTKPKAVEEYYQRMKNEKRRHFMNEPNDQRHLASLALPYALATIDTRLKDIDENVVCGMTTVALRHGQRRANIHLVTAGFGAAIPFYRKFAMTDTLKAIFCAGGMSPADIPNAIFADDDHPSGRVMNRRIEVSLIVDKLSSETNGVSRR
jgi:hypothetical protein